MTDSKAHVESTTLAYNIASFAIARKRLDLFFSGDFVKSLTIGKCLILARKDKIMQKKSVKTYNV